MTHVKKVISEKVTEKLSFFYFFSVYNFVWENFSVFFSQDSNSASQCAFYDTGVTFLPKTLQ